MSKSGRIENQVLEQSAKRKEIDKQRIPMQLLEKQHEFNRKILHEQHSLNLEIHKKQSKLTKWAIFATIAATLLGVLLGHALQSTEEGLMQERPPINSEKTSQ